MSVSTQKIIEVATLNLNTAAQEFTAKVALRNGTTVAGLTKQLEDALKQRMPKVEVTGRDNAKQTTYTETLVVDLTGTKAEDAQRLATLVGGKVGALPEGETKPRRGGLLDYYWCENDVVSDTFSRSFAHDDSQPVIKHLFGFL